MKVVFVDLLNHFYDKHGIYSLASTLKSKGIGVDYVGSTNQKAVFAALDSLQPDAILYSAFSYNIHVYREFDAKIKSKKKIISIMGGPGPTFDYDCINGSTIDAVCVGEGETALVDFLQNGLKSNGNIFYRGEKPTGTFFPFVALDDLPLPDRDVIYKQDRLLRDFPSKQFISGRGCPYECTYCFNHKYKNIFASCGNYVRKKSIRYLIEEIENVRHAYCLDKIVFSDDTLILNKKWFWDFCTEFSRKIGLPYSCNIRPNLVDEDIVKALRDSGCIAVHWSIESGNDFFRNNILKRGISKEQIVNTAALLRQYKIPFRSGNIIGLPGETIENMMETIELNIKVKPNLSLANIFVPYPGLALTQYAIDQKYYLPDKANPLPATFFTRSVLNYGTRDKILIKKILLVFPIFVCWPRIFVRKFIRSIVLSLPIMLLQMIYNLFYPISLMRFYKIKARWVDRFKIFLRQ